MKTRLRFSVLLLLTILLMALLTVDWRFWIQAATYPATPILSTDWYRPMATISGDPQQPLPVATTPDPDIPPAALQAVETYAAERNSTALLVLHRDRIILEKYWQGTDAQFISNGMSMTKTLVGLLVGAAIAEGHIHSVHDPVADYVAEWRNDPRGNLTLEDLLYMQSGLRNDRRTNTPFSDLVRAYLSSHTQAVALSIPLEQPPGQTYSYNNINTLILSIILERATGETFADYLSSRLWQPLQTHDGGLWLDRPGGDAKPFCCFFATARDWARVGLLLEHGGHVSDRSIIPADWIQQMLTPSPLESTFGYHIWLQPRTPDHPNVDTSASVPFLATDTIYLDGRHFQRVYVVPSQELVVVRLGEEPSDWDDSIMPNLLLKAMS